MTRPLDVVLIANALGLGGTEKGLVTHARSFDPARVRVRVVEARENGPRAQELRAAGIDVAGAAGDIDALTPLLAGADVVHVFRSGGFEPLVPSAVRRAGVPVLVETNVFGQVDGSDDERLFSMHLFVSRFCAARYRERRGLGEDALFHDRHRVSTWPLDIERIAEEMPERRAARAALGLDPDRPVVVRVGRPDERKWRDLLAEDGAAAARRGTERAGAARRRAAPGPSPPGGPARARPRVPCCRRRLLKASCSPPTPPPTSSSAPPRSASHAASRSPRRWSPAAPS